MMNTVVYEMDNITGIFPVNFAEEKNTKLKNISFVLLQVWRYFKQRVKEQTLFW